MTPELATVVRRMLTADAGVTDAARIAAHAAAMCRTLGQHLSRLVGELGVRTLFDRSVHLASGSYAVLAVGTEPRRDDSYARLEACLAQEPPDRAMDAAVHVLTTYVGLLERFIGSGLVANLVREVWPTSFSSAAVKEPK